MSIAEQRIFYHWRLAKQGGAYLVGSLVAGCVAGAFIAAARHAPRMAMFHVPAVIALTGFLIFTAVAGLLWWLFSRQQDEMFHRVQNYSYGWGATFSVAVLIMWGIASGAHLAPPIDPIAPLIVFAISKTFFWMRAVRTWL